MNKRKSMVSALMNEYVTISNMLYTRASLFRETLATTGNTWAADMYAFSSQRKTLTPDEVQNLRDYWGQAPSIPEGFWNRTGEVETIPFDYYKHKGDCDGCVTK